MNVVVIVLGFLIICVIGVILLLFLALEERPLRLPKPRAGGIDTL